MQYGVAPEHDSPHFVQLAVVPSCTLQPSAGAPQFFQPAEQLGAHAPALQLVETVCAVPHTTLQPPQLFLSLATDSSQPFCGMESQSA